MEGNDTAVSLAVKPLKTIPVNRSDSESTVITPKPVVVVGNGPVGMRFVAELLRKRPDLPAIIYGEEPCLPYNRIKLSSWLAGEVRLNDILQPLKRPFGTRYEERIGYRVVDIDTSRRVTIDCQGVETEYSKLVLATGSLAYVPPIEGIDTDGVYTLRNMKDANQLLARRVRSHHTVVIGGGLLGLEAARAMQPLNTRVTVVEHADRLMAQQLDLSASRLLENQIKQLGVSVILGDGIRSVQGAHRVSAITLQSGKTIDCDTVVVATGIRPQIDLAKSVGLAVARGVVVNDHMQSSIDSIYAVGECAEHRGEVYGLVAPGLEHAAVAASHIADESNTSAYDGSTAVSRLKVIGTQVFSMGPMGATAHPLAGRKVTYVDDGKDIYRALLVRHHRLIGAVGIGEWAETVRLQSTITDARRLYPWDVLRFRLTGRLFSEQSGEAVAAWPATATVCQCMGVDRGSISQAVARGAGCVQDIQDSTGASTVCGSCKPLVQNLLGAAGKREAAGFSKALLVFSAVAFLALMIVAIFPSLPYARSVQATDVAGISLNQHWDVLWRDGFYKQVSGFTVLGLSVFAAILSFRKRISWFQSVGRFDTWRMVHVLSGVLVVAVLLVHTGFRVGYGLNQLLMLCFLGLILLGSLGSAAISMEHKLGASLSMKLRSQSVWLHILLFLPLPVLLAWHVLKGYWY
ncbi:MAG: FAD-dependent oxidoreductase [Granulosicoccus sp.]|nr:FAD-dependent oxidoreductase [Granulosicoccus sp.]